MTWVFPLEVRSICCSVWLRGRAPTPLKLPPERAKLPPLLSIERWRCSTGDVGGGTAGVLGEDLRVLASALRRRLRLSAKHPTSSPARNFYANPCLPLEKLREMFLHLCPPLNLR